MPKEYLLDGESLTKTIILGDKFHLVNLAGINAGTSPVRLAVLITLAKAMGGLESYLPQPFLMVLSSNNSVMVIEWRSDPSTDCISI